MPELPEVETIVRDLNRKIKGRRITDVWLDTPKMIKFPRSAETFKARLKGRRLIEFHRRGKNILADLDNGDQLLIHQKMSGHLLVGRWQRLGTNWVSEATGPLRDKVNSFIHLIFSLDDGRMLALSDVRKFAKVILASRTELGKLPDLARLGPEPLSPSLTYPKFRLLITKRRRKIKQVLMDQATIVGIGNIYADEILWQAKVNPFRRASLLQEKESRAIFQAMQKILREALRLRGTSTNDYRDPEGKPGLYAARRRVYQREGEPCLRCKTKVKRKKIGNRSAHFCPKCQPRY